MGVELLYVSPGNFQAAREIIEMDPGSESLAVLREDHCHGPELFRKGRVKSYGSFTLARWKTSLSGGRVGGE